MTAGMIDSTLAAARVCVEVWLYMPWKLKMPTAIGKSAGLLIRMNGTMNCDQPRMAFRTKAEVRPGQAERQDHPHEGAPARAAVDHGGVFEALRDAVEEALQHPGEERRRDGDVDEAGAELAVGQADFDPCSGRAEP